MDLQDTDVLVELPGTMTAVWRDGEVTLVFSFSANYAGYFGPAAVLMDGPGEELDITTDDSPFWLAVSKAVGENKVVWE